MELHTGTQATLARIGAISAPIGALMLIISTMLHPMSADPNDAAAAFAEYAADPFWVWSHLGQFAGVAILAMTLIGLAGTLEDGRAAAWGRIGLAGTAATVAAAAALQAVDAVALKVMVDRWAVASGETRHVIFEAAYAVRQVEIGLASFLNIVFGLTLVVLSVAIISSTRYSAWLGAGGLLAASSMLATGTAMALTGFSGLAMALSMVAAAVFLVWIMVAAVFMWRLAPRLHAR